MHIERTIKAGDILTSFTIILSVIALVFSLAKDRAGRTAEQASRVRAAAANAVVKFDRWEGVQLSLYQELQPLFVELSESLATKWDIVAARDRFWREVNRERTRIARQILEEQLSTAYVDIVAHFPKARARYVEGFTKLASVEEEVTSDFLARSEQAIFGFRGKQSSYQTADFGNALRAEASASVAELKRQSAAVVTSARDYLLSVLNMPDHEIVDASRGKRHDG